ncbi:MAG: hypothetical protein ACR2H1_06590, partial [Limisphaerales bacterium]
SALRFDVNWKAKAGNDLKLRLELRGINGNRLTQKTLEERVKKTGWFSAWTSLKLGDKEYRDFGELVAWRASLWDGKNKRAEQKSFLW